MRHGPAPLREALEIAHQIAEALEYAHEHGIVHRDLKPGNVKITPDGIAKVLDFGLGKVVIREAAATDEGELSTLTAEPTRGGLIIGTAAYMSPEQARGKPVDKRADIWAFGCVLYEMLAGTRPFPGRTATEMIAAILKREPEWGKLPAITPELIRRLLSRCLEKDPKRRLRDIGDARLDLEEVRANPSQSERRKPPIMTRRTAIAALAGAAAGTVATMIFSIRMWRGAIPRSLTRSAGAGLSLGHLGQTALDVAGWQPDRLHPRESDTVPPHFYLRSLSDLDSKLVKDVLTGSTVFSPDSRWVAYFHLESTFNAETAAARRRLRHHLVPQGRDGQFRSHLGRR